MKVIAMWRGEGGLKLSEAPRLAASIIVNSSSIEKKEWPEENKYLKGTQRDVRCWSLRQPAVGRSVSLCVTTFWLWETIAFIDIRGSKRFCLKFITFIIDFITSYTWKTLDCVLTCNTFKKKSELINNFSLSMFPFKYFYITIFTL